MPAVSPGETVAGLTAHPRRGPGTDAERRAARWLARELRSQGWRVRSEAFWCRPNWALAHAWHTGLALAGSLVSVSSPRVGAALVLAAIVCVTLDVLTGVSPGRRLTPERASQNVLARPRTQADAPLALILTAALDAGRAGLMQRTALRRAAARVRDLGGDVGPGPAGWLVFLMAWIEVMAILRLGGGRGTVVSVAQLLPTVILVLALALLLEQASSPAGPNVGGAAGVAAAVAVARALEHAAPRTMAIELVLQGAAADEALGLRRHLRRHSRTRRPQDTVVLGFGPCAAGPPCWLRSDGPLVPLRPLGTLRTLAATAAAAAPHLDARPARGHGCWPAHPATARHIPALSLGGLDPAPPDPAGTAEVSNDETVQRVVTLALLLVDGIDAHLAARRRTPAPALTPA